MVCLETHRVTLFLFGAKNAIQRGDIVIAARKKNSDTLARLGLLYRHQLEILKGLTYRDYFNTLPPTDKDPEAWEFGVTEQGQSIYIKLALITDRTGNEYLTCVSFHIATQPITYPYKA